jgi:hypothetical protein
MRKTIDEERRRESIGIFCGRFSAPFPRLSFAHFSQGVTVEKSSKLSSSGTAGEAIF